MLNGKFYRRGWDIVISINFDLYCADTNTLRVAETKQRSLLQEKSNL